MPDQRHKTRTLEFFSFFFFLPFHFGKRLCLGTDPVVSCVGVLKVIMGFLGMGGGGGGEGEEEREGRAATQKPQSDFSTLPPSLHLHFNPQE